MKYRALIESDEIAINLIAAIFKEEKKYNSVEKLSFKDIEDIKQMYGDGITKKEIIAKYNLSYPALDSILINH